jgi:peptidyl-prolyl cis-trans isomerase A (cyclophilin A)
VHASISGLRYISAYLDPGTHDRILAQIDSQPWQAIGDARRIQFFGYWYDRNRGGLRRIGDLPAWSGELAARLEDDGLMPYRADQLIVSEYQPGQGIREHIDAPLFEGVIAGISLGSACVMEFSHKTRRTEQVLLEPGSVLVLSDEARDAWQHSIPARETDTWMDRTFPRSRRVSLTFRKMRAGVLGVALVLFAVLGAAGCGQALRKPAALRAVAPPTYKVLFDTTAGSFVVEVHRDWAPHGADRFYNLVKRRFYDNTRFFRVVPGFMVQFGIHGEPAVSAAWRDARIPVDQVKASNTRGLISYAMAGSPDTRTTQVFINFQDNSRLDSLGFAPFGEVISGMHVVDRIYSVYGEGAPRGQGPEQGRLQTEGNAYLAKDFTNLDYIRHAIVQK